MAGERDPLVVEDAEDCVGVEKEVHCWDSEGFDRVGIPSMSANHIHMAVERDSLVVEDAEHFVGVNTS
jgi:hypothetical protein